MRRLLSVLVIVLIYILWSCDSNNRSYPMVHMAFDNVSYIEHFPQSVFADGEKIYFDVIGVRSFLIYDSLMIMSTVNTDSLWVAVSLSDLQVQGSMLKTGQGPFEFVFPPSVSNNTKIAEEQNQLFTYVYDMYKGELLKLNISASLSEDHTDISILNNSLPKSLFNFVVINDSTFLCKEAKSNHTQQIRFIDNAKQERKQLSVLDKLNNVAIRHNEDINILSTITKHNPSNDLIIEMPIGLNYINMYTLDSSIAKTLCIGKRLYNIEQIQNTNEWSRIYTFADVRLFSDFWGVLYMNETEKNYQIKRKKFPTVLLFDWHGNPLVEIKLNHLATSFDIDTRTNDLYTFDVETDLFVKYNLSAVFK